MDGWMGKKEGEEKKCCDAMSNLGLTEVRSTGWCGRLRVKIHSCCPIVEQISPVETLVETYCEGVTSLLISWAASSVASFTSSGL